MFQRLGSYDTVLSLGIFTWPLQAGAARISTAERQLKVEEEEMKAKHICLQYTQPVLCVFVVCFRQSVCLVIILKGRPIHSLINQYHSTSSYVPVYIYIYMTCVLHHLRVLHRCLECFTSSEHSRKQAGKTLYAYVYINLLKGYPELGSLF